MPAADPPCPAHPANAQPPSSHGTAGDGPAAQEPGTRRGWESAVSGAGAGEDVLLNCFRTSMLWLLFGVSWEEPRLRGSWGLWAAATSPLSARAGAPRRAAGTSTHCVH